MRLLLALMAVLALLASPATAAAAQARCGQGATSANGMPVSGMTMGEMAGGDHAAMAKAADPCCDPAARPNHPNNADMSCVQNCAAMCGLVAALPEPIMSLPAQTRPAAPPPTVTASLRSLDPPRLERPPKLIA